jgi:ribonuclease HI
MSTFSTMPATSRPVVYTDGACSGNPGPGGWAWAVAPDGERKGSGGSARTTNQRMEITAVLEALRAVPGPLVIVSDSTYVVNCFRDRWWVRWEANGWRNAKKQPVANADLWRPLVELVKQRQPEFRWVKGHSGDAMNDVVDALAVAASRGPFPPDVADPAEAAGDRPTLF